MQSFTKIIFLSLLFLAKNGLSQIKQATVLTSDITFLEKNKYAGNKISLENKKISEKIFIPYDCINRFAVINTSPISQRAYYNQLGFICKKEIQLQKTTFIAFRFRLGSLDYVNKMEGKYLFLSF